MDILFKMFLWENFFAFVARTWILASRACFLTFWPPIWATKKLAENRVVHVLLHSAAVLMYEK